jgi:DNA gyrase subunit A
MSNDTQAASTPPEGSLVQVSIESEMRSAYLDYAMSVIVGRAIPDARDGLKPVHRRILFAMHEAKNFYNQAYKKSARVVGDVIGKYHPHGDAAVYDTLVRMAQEFSMGEVLVDGQGNFGSLDGDPPAAMRYTEVRLTPLAHMLLEGLEQETVDWLPNYDESLQEPRVLPAAFPNVLVNGAKGIAVGMATNIPPHNLGEVIEATVALIRNPDITITQLMKVIPGPDFPTGGLIIGLEGVRNAFETGQGSIVVRAKTHIEEEERKGRSRIIVSEVPYQTNKAKILERIAELVREKKIPGISDVRDESNREGVRVVVELKKDASPQIVLNQLFKMTALQDTFDVKNLSIVKGQPKVMNLKETLREFIEFRVEVVTRRSKFELRKAEERLHILEGLRTAVDNIDETIAIIRDSKSTQEAETRLMARFSLSEKQVKAILDMRLARLTGLERQKIEDEMKDLSALIAELMTILSDKSKLFEVIIRELEAIKTKFSDERRSEIQGNAEEIREEDLIPEEDMVVAVSRLGYIKRTPVSVFRSQGRGGKGVMGMETRGEDFIKDIYICSSHATMLFFSDRGKVYSKKVYEIPPAARTARGKAIINFVGMGPGENVAAVVPISEMKEGCFIITATTRGYVKKSDIMLFSNIRMTGIIGVVIEDGDRLVEAAVTDGSADLLLCTKKGASIRFSEDQVRSMGRASRGVTGIKLKNDDEVVGMSVLTSAMKPVESEADNGEPQGAEEEPEADEDSVESREAEEYTVLTVCSRGYGKRTNLSEHRRQRRGGKGIIAIRTTQRNGDVVGMTVVRESDDVMIVTTQGTFIRTPVETISVIGRNTQGVRLIKLGEEELVSSVDKITVSEDIDKDEPPADGEADSGSGREEPSEDGAPGTESAGPEEADERLEDEGEEENGDMAGDWESALLDKSKPK